MEPGPFPRTRVFVPLPHGAKGSGGGDTGRAVVDTCCSACSALSSAGQGGLHASSSGVPALPGEVLALSITSIHLRRGFRTVRTGTPSPAPGRLFGKQGACSGHQTSGFALNWLPKSDPK